MSLAIKISTVQQAELAINQLNDRLRNTKNALERSVRESTERARREAERIAAQKAEENRREFDRKLANGLQGVDSTIKRLDAEQRRRLEAVADNMRNVVAEADRKLRSDMNRAISSSADALRTEFKNGLDNLHRSVNASLRHQQSQIDAQGRRLDDQELRLNAISETVNDIINHINDTRLRRQRAVELARGSYESAVSSVDVARFCPEDHSEILRRLDALERNSNDEGTVATARETILRIHAAAEEATRRKIIYDALKTQAEETVATVLNEVNANRVTRVANPADETDIVELETDFWSHGEYGEIEHRLATLQSELAQEPTLDRIRAINEEVAELQARSERLVQEAARKAILSENRVTVTEDIITALQRQGWEVDKRADGTDAVDFLGGDCDSDWREGFYAVVKSVHGDNISIVVEPDDNGIDNRLIFQRNDNRNLSGAEYLNTVRRICSQIEQSGHKVAAPQAPSDGGDQRIPELTNPANLSRRGTAQKVRQRIRKH